jgi:hypothetical protein
MKTTDIAMLILIASVSIMVAYGVVSAVPGLKFSGQTAKVKTIDLFSSDVQKPDPNVFNPTAINPTVDVTIGGK